MAPRSAAAAAALEHATPRARRLAARLAPLYENWTGRSAAERRDLLVGIVNEQLRAAGMPEVKAAFGSGGAGERGRFVPSLWELHLSAELLGGHSQTPEQFAKACETAIHEGHHAMQTFRAARTNPVMAEKHLEKGAFKAVMDANLPGSKAEKVKLSALEWVEAANVRESMWGSGQTHQKEVYARMDAADAHLGKMLDRFHIYKKMPPGSPEKRKATLDVLEATRARDAAHDDYMRLPEEVEAWKIGLETRAAVAERIKLDAQIAKARRDVEAAHEAFSKIDGPLLEQLADPVNPPTAQAQLAWERALNLERMKRNILRSFIERRTRLVLGTT